MNILGFHWTCATFIDFPRYTATVHNAKKYFARLGWRSRRHEEIWRIQCCHLISGRSYHRRSCQVSVPPMLLDPDVAQFWEAQVLSSSCDLVLVRLSFLDSNFECPRTSSNIFDPFLWRITWPRWPHLRRHLLQQWIHRLAKAHCCSRGPLGQTESKRSDKFHSWHVWNKNFEHLWTI